MDDDFKKGLLGVTTEVGGGIATDVATTPLLGLGPAGIAAYVATNFGQGAYTNYLVQKHLYGNENINWGEVFGSGVAGAIPFMNIPTKSLKAAKYVGKAGSVKRGIVGGLGTALVGEQTRVGIDEKRRLTLQEIAFAGGLGGTLGGGLTSLGRQTKLNQLKKVRATQQKNRKTKRNLKKLQENIKKEQPPIPGGAQEKFTREGLKGVLLQATGEESYQPRVAPINTVNLTTKGMAVKLNQVAAELGYEPPSTIVPIKKFSRFPDMPQDIASLYVAHERAYWEYIHRTLANNPGAKVDMRSFPDLIHKGISYRPQMTTKVVNGQQILSGASIVDENTRMSRNKLGRTRRLDVMNELNTYSGANTRAWLQSKKSKIDALNAKLVSEGKHPIGDTHLHGDHRIPAAMTQAYAAGLSPKYKKIVYDHIVQAGGMLGDEIDNVAIYNAAINIQKESKLKYYIKLRRHKSAQSFGKFDKKNPRSYQTEAQQKARVEYYTTPTERTGLTPIEEYIQDVYKAEQWAEESMDAVLKALPVIKPEELRKLSDADYKVIVEIFGSIEAAATFVERLRANVDMGMPKAMIQEMVYDEIWERISGIFK
tara:strand:+ start:335 stop:2119 length:1785 start_codon:yes stop_codon:yes gene_type:complete